MLIPCKHCPSAMHCQRLGCYAFNDKARKEIDREMRDFDERRHQLPYVPNYLPPHLRRKP